MDGDGAVGADALGDGACGARHHPLRGLDPCQTLPGRANPAGGQSGQAIGRTKGGLNTKLTALVDSFGRAVALSVHPGQRHDVRTMDAHACMLRGRTLVADKGFDADGLRARVAYFGGRTCIPRRRNCGGARPFSARLYRRRHRVENFWCRLKRHRRLSTRYDKLAAILDWLKN